MFCNRQRRCLHKKRNVQRNETIIKNMEHTIKIIHSETGETLGIAGGNYRIIISGAETNGNYAVIEMLVPPNGGPPPHSHPDTQEMFYVVEGEFEFKTATGKQIVDKGGFVNIPFGGAIHCFKNSSDKIEISGFLIPAASKISITPSDTTALSTN